MAIQQTVIRLRIDVDYPYPSARAKSFLYIALGIKKKKGEDYLRNARIIARMINESPKQVKATWFFTPFTIPDEKLLSLLNVDRHEVGLHVATNPYSEWKILENETDRTVKYYTIHGTSVLFAQLLWRRRPWQKQVAIPRDFPLKSFHDFTNCSLDMRRYEVGYEDARRQAQEWINQNCVLSMHPEWLFKKGDRNHRGPYHDVLKHILDPQMKFESSNITKKAFFKMAHGVHEYEKSVNPTDELLDLLSAQGVDIFTFIERSWCCRISNPPSTWIKEEDNVALLEIKDYETWWNEIDKKTRNMVRKAEKKDVKVIVTEPNEKFIEGVWKIYNETPIRQERAFPHYGQSLDSVAWNIHTAKNSTFIGAFLKEELVGFIQMVHGDNIVVISQILSMQEHWDKSLNNALLAKAVEICASKGERWLLYGRVGNHPSLDRFKESNGFAKFSITRYYIPLTRKGKVAMNLGLNRDVKDVLPQDLKNSLIPVMNWISRTKVKIRFGSKKQNKN